MSMAPVAEPGNGQMMKYEPTRPIGSAGGLKALLAANKLGIAQALPRHVTPERLIKTMLVAANRTPSLLQCTQASILETINRAAELGLDLSGTLGEAYPVPFGGQCQLVIGYRGFAKLAWQSGEIEYIEAEVVYQNDKFVYRKGMNGTLEFEPLFTGDRGKPIGAYALVRMKGGGCPRDFMSVDQIEAVRQKAPSRNSAPWKEHWGEMAKKTVFRRVAKWLPLSTEKFVRAMEVDNDDPHDTDALDAATAPERGVNSLLKRITSKPVSEGQAFEPSEEEAERILRDAAAKANQETPAEDPNPPGNEVPPEQEAEAGSDAERCSTVAGFMDAINRTAMEREMPSAELTAWISARLLKAGLKGKMDKTSLPWRIEALNDLRNGVA